MTNLQSDELLREVLAELRAMGSLLAERLPERQQAEVSPPSKTAVVTGEGAGEGADPSPAVKRGPGRPRKSI